MNRSIRPLAFESSFSVIASKLNAGCGGYLDKIYKILVEILDLKACFPFANFFIRSDFFLSKTIESRIGSYFMYFKKSR